MIQLYETKDGSKTLLNTALNETYHSRNGAIQESLHVFIRAGFEHLLEKNPQITHISILEIGFGTGLNALLTLQKHLNNPQISIYYEAIDILPLPYYQVQELGYLEQINDARLALLFEKMHEAEWDKALALCPHFTLHKRRMSLTEFASKEQFHLVYFDAFAPNVQPEMWQIEPLEKIKKVMLRDAIFVSYCAKGQFRRDLKELGFYVEKLAGPPGKREMTRAKLTSNVA
ncbi:MAG: tRNA (5-methylaminomethyl-2-thiouridine)(34)-methyltransferase MnmD [Raineya sp.]